MCPLNFTTLNTRRRRVLTPSAARRRAGFTVLELVVVMFIAVLVTGMSMGKLHDISNQQKVIRAASTIRTSAEAAFALATRNRKPIRMVWDASTMQFRVTDRAGTTVFRRVVLNSSEYNLPSGAVTVSASPIEVYPDGLASDTLRVVVSANSVVDTIRVSRAGMVRVTK
jgi:Tfp pilus assembly protein FimT